MSTSNGTINTYTYLPPVQIAHVLVSMNEDTCDYSEHVHGAQAIAHIVADLHLDHDAVNAWFADHGDEINQAIHVQLVDRDLI
jgi:hypothetical protein